MISSCRRWQSPPMTTSRAWATIARCWSTLSGTIRAVIRCQTLSAPSRDQTSARKQPQAHLHEPMVQVDQNDILPALGEVVLEDEGASFAGERVRKALGALFPTAAQGRQMEDRAGFALRVGPDAGDFGRNQRRLPGQLQGDLDDLLDVLRRKPQFPLRLL